MVSKVASISQNIFPTMRFVSNPELAVKVGTVAITALSAFAILNDHVSHSIGNFTFKVFSRLPLFKHLLRPSYRYSNYVEKIQTKKGNDRKLAIKSMAQELSIEESLNVIYRATHHSKFGKPENLQEMDFSQKDFDHIFAQLNDTTISKESLVNTAKQVRLSYDPLTASRLKSPIEKRASKIDFIATQLSEFLLAISGKFLKISSLIKHIAEYPKTLFTLVFAFLVPISFVRLWELIKPSLELVFGPLASIESKHGGKITLVAFAATALTYYFMRKENVNCITNLGMQLKYNGLPHKALHTLDCYSDTLSKFKTIFQTQMGRNGSSAFLVHEKDAEGSLLAVPDMIAELSQTAEEEGINDKCNIWRVNIDTLTSECDDLNELKVEWFRIARESRKKYAMLDLGDFKWITEALNQTESGPSGETKEKRLAKLILSSIERGQIRAFFRGDKEHYHTLSHMPIYAKLFTPIETPPIPPESIEEVVRRVYNPQDRWKNLRLSEYAIKQLINIAKNHEWDSELPEEIDHVNDVLRQVGAERRQKPVLKSEYTPQQKKLLKERHASNEKKLNTIAEGKGKKLDSARKLKEKLLRTLWSLRQKGKTHENAQVVALSKKLLILENVIIPTLKEEVQKELQALDNYPTEITYDDLIDSLNEHFRNILGPPSNREKELLKNLPNEIKKQIKGRDREIDDVCEAIEKWRINPASNMEHEPLVLKFVGPPGTGKSKFAEILAKELLKVHSIIKNPVDDPNIRSWNLPDHLKRSYFDEDMIVQVLDHMKNNPTGITVLEEMDKLGKSETYKPNEDVSPLDQLLLLIGDTKIKYQKGPDYLKSQENESRVVSIDRRNHIIIITSNDLSKEGELGPEYEKNKEKALKNSSEKYGAPFAQRVSCIVPFNALNTSSSDEYVDKFIDKYKAQYEEIHKGIIQIDQSATDHLKEAAKIHNGSIREIKKFIKTEFTKLFKEKALYSDGKVEHRAVWNATLKYENPELKVSYL